MYWTNFISFLFNLLIYKKVVYVLILSFYGQNEKGKEERKLWPSPTGIRTPDFWTKLWILREIRSIELKVLKKSRLYQRALLWFANCASLLGMDTKMLLTIVIDIVQVHLLSHFFYKLIRVLLHGSIVKSENEIPYFLV